MEFKNRLFRSLPTVFYSYMNQRRTNRENNKSLLNIM